MSQKKSTWSITKTFIGIGAFAVMALFIPLFLLFFLFMIVAGYWVMTNKGVTRTSKK